jgi:AcrR family transcriptional regulator
MARKARGPLTQEEGGETREIILRVAQQLFMTYGYRSVTTRQLAEACGLTQPALYHHFADKQELYLAMVQEEIAKIRGTLERLARRSEDVPAVLKQVAIFLLNRVQYDLDLMLHDVRYELSPDARQVLDEQFHQGFLLPIAQIFATAVRQGYLLDEAHGGVSPISFASLFMTLLSRFTIPPQEESDLATRQARQTSAAELVVRLLFFGLGNPDKR